MREQARACSKQIKSDADKTIHVQKKHAEILTFLLEIVLIKIMSIESYALIESAASCRFVLITQSISTALILHIALGSNQGIEVSTRFHNALASSVLIASD